MQAGYCSLTRYATFLICIILLSQGGNKNCPPPSHLTSTALELTETGKSRKVLDSLAYPLDGSGSRSLDAALNSSLTFVRELKFKEKRKVAREAGLGAEMASKMLSTAEKGRESIAFGMEYILN